MTRAEHSLEKIVLMLSLNAASIVLIALLAGACVCKDGSFLYTISGKLIDGDGRPLADMKFVIVPERFDTFHSAGRTDFDRLSEWFNVQITDKRGAFKYEYMTGLAWGGCKPLGMGIRQPQTPRIETVNIYCLTGEDSWAFKVLDVPDAGHVPEKIEMGSINL
ncbi:MAG: hypothetical protein ABIJ56_00440 [Pseudomonadota bacterium]